MKSSILLQNIFLTIFRRSDINKKYMKENAKIIKVSDYFYFHLGSLSWINGALEEKGGGGWLSII